MTTALVLITAVAPPAAADPYPDLAPALDVARSAASCEALRYDPRVEQAAEIVNRTTHDYVAHTAENVPADEQHPTSVIADLGITAGKVQSLQGAAKVDGDAIQALLIQGHKILADCSYTEVGASILREPQSGYTLVVVILVGP